MINLIIGFLLLVLSSFSFAKEIKIPDLLVYTKTENNWNLFLIKEFRTFMNNLNLDVDPYSFSASDPMVYSEESVQKYVSDNANDLLHKVGNAIGLNYSLIQPELIVTKFGYKITEIKPKIKPIENGKGNVKLKTKISLRGVKAFASDISLKFKIPGLTKTPTVKIINPRVIVKDDFFLDFNLNILLQEEKNQIRVGLRNGDFSKITSALSVNPDMIKIEFDEIQIPEIKMRFGGRDLELNRQKILTIINEYTPTLKIILFEQIHEIFKKDGAKEILRKFDNIAFAKKYWIESHSENMFPMMLKIEDFSVPAEGIFLTHLSGDFCTTRNYVAKNDDCIYSRVTKTPEIIRSEIEINNSKKEILNLMKLNKDIKFVGSISEEYISKAIVTTIDFGLWESLLASLEVRLGDKGVLVKLNEKGDTATIILDVIYDVGKFLGSVLKERFVRFPVILKANIRSENIDNNAGIILNIQDVVLDDDKLIYGYKEYGFPSTVQNIRGFLGLRNKAVKMIKKELFDYTKPLDPQNFTKWKGVDLPPLFLPEIKDMEIDKMEMQSDSFGRLNLILKESDIDFLN